MRVHFWSSTEYSGFLEALVHQLTRIGIPAKQRFQVSEASYRSAKKVSERLWLRLRQYLFYPIQLCISLIWERFRSRFLGVLSRGNRSDAEAVVVSTNTFYAPLLATLVHPNVVHLVYDLFPEAMIHSGKWTEGSLKVRIVRWITKQTLKRAKTNVFLGQRLKDYVESIHGPVENAAIIAVGADQALFSASPKQRSVKRKGGNVKRAGSGDVAHVKTRTREGGSVAAGSDVEEAHAKTQRREGEGEVGLLSDVGMCDAAGQCLDGKPEVCPEGGTEAGALGAVEEQTLTDDGGDHPDLASKSPLLEKEGCLEGSSLLKAFEHSYSSGDSSPTIFYCGNFGNMHESATLFDFWNLVAESVKREEGNVKRAGSDEVAHADLNEDAVSCSLSSVLCNEISWKFHCSGPKRVELEAVHAELPDVLKERIRVGEGLGQAEWIRTMEAADVALVTMVPGSETVVMPSKAYSAMMAGQAILAIAPKDSDLVDTIRAADCGWHVEPGDVDGLARAVEMICSDAGLLLEKRENGFQYAHAHFGQDALAKEWRAAVLQLKQLTAKP